MGSKQCIGAIVDAGSIDRGRRSIAAGMQVEQEREGPNQLLAHTQISKSSVNRGAAGRQGRSQVHTYTQGSIPSVVVDGKKYSVGV